MIQVKILNSTLNTTYPPLQYELGVTARLSACPKCNDVDSLLQSQNLATALSQLFSGMLKLANRGPMTCIPLIGKVRGIPISDFAAWV